MQNNSRNRTGRSAPHRLNEPPRHRKRRKRRSSPIPTLLVLAVILAALWFGWHTFSSFTERLSSRFEEPAHAPYCPYDSENFSAEGELAEFNDPNYTTLQGIDVSSHQGEIDWSAAASDGIDFVIVRAGWRGYSNGDTNTDELFLTNLQGAKANGLKVGAYFYSQAITPEEAREEARLVLTALDGYSLDLPIYYDWELPSDSDARTQGLDYDTLTRCAAAFCSTIEAGGYDAGVYFYRALGENEYDLSQLTDYSFWLSDPGSAPDFLYEFSMWQYNLEGTISGISEQVDRDLLILPADTQ